jgi:hypothetical protein
MRILQNGTPLLLLLHLLLPLLLLLLLHLPLQADSLQYFS